jgi:hypothetical protein
VLETAMGMNHSLVTPFAHIIVFDRGADSLMAGFAAPFANQTAFLGKSLKSLRSP